MMEAAVTRTIARLDAKNRRRMVIGVVACVLLAAWMGAIHPRSSNVDRYIVAAFVGLLCAFFGNWLLARWRITPTHLVIEHGPLLTRFLIPRSTLSLTTTQDGLRLHRSDGKGDIRLDQLAPMPGTTEPIADTISEWLGRPAEGSRPAPEAKSTIRPWWGGLASEALWIGICVGAAAIAHLLNS